MFNRIFQLFSNSLEPALAPAQQWFMAREQRERWLIVCGAIALVIGGWYTTIQQPLQQKRQQLEQRNSADAATLSWMRDAAVQIRAQGGPSTVSSQSGSLLSIADSSLRKQGLGEALQRIQPEDDNSVKIWLDGAQFNTLLTWLSKVENQGLRVSVAGITPAPGQTARNGLVNARITLNRPA